MRTSALRARVRARVAAVVVVAVALSVASARAGAQSTVAKRKCERTTLPKQLPAADVVIDSAMVLAVLAESIPGEGAGILVTLLYPSGATTPALHLLAPDSLPADSSGRILDVLRPNLRTLAPETAPWAVRLRVRGGPRASLRLERAVFCPPADRDPQERRIVSRRTVVMNESQRLATPPRSMPRIDFEVLISAEGEVTETRWHRRSGDLTVDADFELFWRQQRFHPATVDGIAIPSWLRPDGTRMRM